MTPTIQRETDSNLHPPEKPNNPSLLRSFTSIFTRHLAGSLNNSPESSKESFRTPREALPDAWKQQIIRRHRSQNMLTPRSLEDVKEKEFVDLRHWGSCFGKIFDVDGELFFKAESDSGDVILRVHPRIKPVLKTAHPGHTFALQNTIITYDEQCSSYVLESFSHDLPNKLGIYSGDLVPNTAEVPDVLAQYVMQHTKYMYASSAYSVRANKRGEVKVSSAIGGEVSPELANRMARTAARIAHLNDNFRDGVELKTQRGSVPTSDILQNEDVPGDVVQAFLLNYMTPEIRSYILSARKQEDPLYFKNDYPKPDELRRKFPSYSNHCRNIIRDIVRSKISLDSIINCPLNQSVIIDCGVKVHPLYGIKDRLSNLLTGKKPFKIPGFEVVHNHLQARERQLEQEQLEQEQLNKYNSIYNPSSDVIANKLKTDIGKEMMKLKDNFITQWDIPRDGTEGYFGRFELLWNKFIAVAQLRGSIDREFVKSSDIYRELTSKYLVELVVQNYMHHKNLKRGGIKPRTFNSKMTDIDVKFTYEEKVHQYHSDVLMFLLGGSVHFPDSKRRHSTIY